MNTIQENNYQFIGDQVFALPQYVAYKQIYDALVAVYQDLTLYTSLTKQ